MARKRFVNPHFSRRHPSFWDFIRWKLGHYEDGIAVEPAPAHFSYPALAKPFQKELAHAVWIGHSTYLIEVGGLCILTDPVWDSYCSPIPIQRLKRNCEPPILLADLPPIDLVLISHNHYDHLDAKTVVALNQFHPQIEWVVPEGLSNWFYRRGIHSVTELKWWSTNLIKRAKITAVPTQHFSGRTLWDTNTTHWNGYVLEIGGKKLYFTGDTGYNDQDFKQIGDHFLSMDLSLIPIGTYFPQKFMQPIHISPYEAVQIHQEVRSRLSLGMHWKTFRLSSEPIDRPPYDLYLAMKEKNLSFDTFLPIDIGTHVNF